MINQRILIVGNKAAGKTALAVQLARETGLPLVHLDAVFWQSGWKLATLDERRRSLKKIADGNNWIAVGYAELLEQMADQVVFIDQPRWKCLLRYLGRVLRSPFSTRSQMPVHCPEILGLYSSLIQIWRFEQDLGKRLRIEKTTDQRYRD
jgi:adenylate kinase family enzyme